jgi:hypothetical protein
MIVRLVPYAEISVSVTMSLDEATALTDVLELLRGQGSEVQKVATDLRNELNQAMERAIKLRSDRGY